MSSNEYHFITHWEVAATLDEVFAVLADARDLPRWWPSVYLAAHELAPGDTRGIGKKIALKTKGWLPYTLGWQFEITAIDARSITLVAQGDFVGQGIWHFLPLDGTTKITYDWRIHAEKPLLKWLSPVLKPFFGANHRWAMQQGERSLALEVRRRRATTAAERQSIPDPPPATTTSPWPLSLAFAAVVFFSWIVSRRVRR